MRFSSFVARHDCAPAAVPQVLWMPLHSLFAKGFDRFTRRNSLVFTPLAGSVIVQRTIPSAGFDDGNIKCHCTQTGTQYYTVVIHPAPLENTVSVTV